MIIQDVAPPPAVVQTQAPAELGRQARLRGDTADAVRLLAAAAAVTPDDVDVQFDYGLALYAAGRMDEAEVVLDRASRLAPGYADVTVARARLAAAQGRSADARRLAEPLARTGNRDAAGVLARLSATTEAKRWRVDVWGAHSELSGGQADWRATGMALGGRLSPNVSASLSVEHTERFGLEDVYAEANVERGFGAWSGWLAVGGAADADYRAEVSAAAGGRAHGWAVGNGRVQPLLAARWSRYRTGEVVSVDPGVVWENDRASVEARWINVNDETGTWRDGWSLTGQYRLTDQVSIDVLAADAPETSEGRTLTTRAAGAGVRFAFNPTTSVRLGWLGEDRGTAGERRETAVSLTRRF